MRTMEEFVQELAERGRDGKQIRAVSRFTRWDGMDQDIEKLLDSEDGEEWLKRGKARRLDERLAKAIRFRVRKIKQEKKPTLKKKLKRY